MNNFDLEDMFMSSSLDLDSFINGPEFVDMGTGIQEDRIRPSLASPKLLSTGQAFVFDNNQPLPYGVQEQAPHLDVNSMTSQSEPVIYPPLTSPEQAANASVMYPSMTSHVPSHVPSHEHVNIVDQSVTSLVPPPVYNVYQPSTPVGQTSDEHTPYQCMPSPASTHAPSPGYAQALSPYFQTGQATDSFFDAENDVQVLSYPTEETCADQGEQYSGLFEGLSANQWADINQLIVSDVSTTDIAFSTDFDVNPSAQCSDEVMKYGSLDLERCLSPEHLAQYRSLPLPAVDMLQKSVVKEEPLDEYPVTQCAPRDVKQPIEDVREKSRGRRKRKDAMSDNQIQQEIDRPIKRLNTGEMSADELQRYERRKQQNREAAARCRIKKKQQSTVTVETERKLREDNETLEREVEDLRAEVTRLTSVLAGHPCVRCSNVVPQHHSNKHIQPPYHPH